MKENIKELTEGMQRLCAIANRIVSHQGEVSQIEKDLLLEDLRQLYDVALRISGEEQEKKENLSEKNEESADTIEEPDEEMLSSTVMATMAAMGVSEVKAEPVAVPAVEPEPEPEPETSSGFPGSLSAAVSPGRTSALTRRPAWASLWTTALPKNPVAPVMR